MIIRVISVPVLEYKKEKHENLIKYKTINCCKLLKKMLKCK